jgi:putrescine transport system permease protein
MRRLSGFNLTALTFGFAFLYIPILLLILYSFNESRLVTVWGGFSLKWYGELLRNESYLRAAWVTLRVGLVTATLATFIALFAAITLVRRRRFFGRTLFTGMIYTPLVMPEVMMGLSLALLFVSLGVDRGMVTIILAHTTFATAFASVVISSRLVDVDPSLEEAAMDLGCSPTLAFIKVLLPVIAPAVAAAWLLAFTLSLDDLVIATFVAGPSATTLPMKVFSQVRLGVTPEVNALSTLLIALVSISVMTLALVHKRVARPME